MIVYVFADGRVAAYSASDDKLIWTNRPDVTAVGTAYTEKEVAMHVFNF